jgi:hypothetical protein
MIFVHKIKTIEALHFYSLRNHAAAVRLLREATTPLQRLRPDFFAGGDGEQFSAEAAAVRALQNKVHRSLKLWSLYAQFLFF